MKFNELLSRFEGKRTQTATGWTVCCPGHGDSTPSLSVSDKGDKALLHCHAGCATDDVCAAMGLSPADLFYEPLAKREGLPAQLPKRVVAKYDYCDESGAVLYTKVRFDPKTFGWERPDGSRTLGDVRRVPYHLPQLMAAKAGELVWIVEGEKDAENLTAAGASAVTSSKDWQAEWAGLFAGRNVVVVADNDKAGDKIAKQVEANLGKAPSSVSVIKVPGAIDGGDVSDWLRGGGTYAALVRLVSQRADRFVTAPERAVDERTERLDKSRRILSFGIPYLDHALTGIMPSDVVLCSAATGAGKTEAAATVGLAVAGSGKRVHMFALEAEPREIERRIKYRLIADLYYASGRGLGHRPIRYQEWDAGLLEKLLGRYEKDATEQFAEIAKNLKTYYRAGDFTGSDFVRTVAEIAEETDLVILDHLHYLDSEEANENAGYKRITKQIRDSALTNGKPMFCVAHIRKSDRFSQRLVPSIEDIHGSSDITKIATKAFMLARADDQQSSAKHISNTYVQVVKNRTDGSVCRYVAMVKFDIRTNSYSGDYEMFAPIDGGKSMCALSGDEIPSWATGAARAAPPENYYDPITGETS